MTLSWLGPTALKTAEEADCRMIRARVSALTLNQATRMQSPTAVCPVWREKTLHHRLASHANYAK